MITGYLIGFGYVDKDYNVTDAYKKDLAAGTLQPVYPGLKHIEGEIHTLIQATFDESITLESMIENGNASADAINKLNENFSKKEFQTLWNEINHKYVYTVHYDSKELIEKAISAIDRDLTVTELKYVMTVGDQDTVDTFGDTKTSTKALGAVSTSTVKYDLVGEVAKRTTLTRRTVATILKGIKPIKLAMFRNNPEEFIKNVSRIIKDEKATMIVEHIEYENVICLYLPTFKLRASKANRSSRPEMAISSLALMKTLMKM